MDSEQPRMRNRLVGDHLLIRLGALVQGENAKAGCFQFRGIDEHGYRLPFSLS